MPSEALKYLIDLNYRIGLNCRIDLNYLVPLRMAPIWRPALREWKT